MIMNKIKGGNFMKLEFKRKNIKIINMDYINIKEENGKNYLEVGKMDLKAKYNDNKWLIGHLKDSESDSESDSSSDEETEDEKELKPLETIEALKIYCRMLNEDEREKEFKRLNENLNRDIKIDN